jgi:hypothetical protein
MASRAPAAPRGVARFLAKPRGKPASKTPPPVAGPADGEKPGEAGKAAPALKIPELLAELEEHFKQLSVRVTYEALGGELGSGGLCKVRGQYRVIIDKRTTPSERVAMLLPLLPRFAGDDLQVSHTLRDLLLRLRPADKTESPDAPSATEGATVGGEESASEPVADLAPAEPATEGTAEPSVEAEADTTEAEDLGDSASAHEVQAGEPAPSPAA